MIRFCMAEAIHLSQVAALSRGEFKQLVESEMSSEEVKVYVRNSKKYGKILSVPASIPSEQLYRLAAASHGLAAEEVRLIIGGAVLAAEGSEVALKEKAIVHLINLREVNVEAIEVTVRPLHARSGPVKIETRTDVTIREFIDDKLHKVYGEKSDVLLLVHIGRQLNLERSFREELIENGSELTVANIQELKNRKSAEAVREEQSEPIAVPIKDLEVPEEPKDIYPQPNFTIAVPQEVNASINMELIFDSKVRHASSLQNCSLEPEEIIPEEEVVAKISEEAQEEDTDREGQRQEREEELKEEGEGQKEQDVVAIDSAEPVISAEAIEVASGESGNAEDYSIEAVQRAEEEAVPSAQFEAASENRNFTEEGRVEVSSELRRPEDATDQF